jgi:uncharacterized phage protein gp47/JayE
VPLTFRKSVEDLKSQARTRLEAGGVITNLSEGGAAKALLDITALQIADLYDALDFQVVMSRLSSASGVFLDMIGQSRGLPRGSAASAVVSRDDRVIRFFSNTGGPIKTLLPGARVAEGTLIYSTGSTISYQVSADAFPNDVQTEIFVSAVSVGTGATQNVGVGVLSSHDLGAGDVEVTNVEAIATAQDTESDANYRFRISRALAKAAGATEDAIRLAAFSVPGVASVTIRPFSDGIGTLEVLVVPVGNKFPTDTLRAINAVVRRAVAVGTRVRVKAPEPIATQLTIQLEFKKDVSSADRSQLREQVRQAVLSYMSQISVGGQFILNELIQRVLDVSDRILDMKVLLYRFRAQNHVLRNVQADADELFVPDDTQVNAIRII